MMTVFARQASYRFVNMIDRLTSDNYFLATSSRIPCNGKIRKAGGHVGRESFWFPDGKALAGCCCRSKFSRLALRRDYTPIRYRCHWRWLSAKRKLALVPRHSFPSTLGSTFPALHQSFHQSSFSQTVRNRSALADESPRIPFLPRRRQVPRPEISIFHIQDFSSRSPLSPCSSC